MSLEFSPDGKTIMMAPGFGVVYLFDMECKDIRQLDHEDWPCGAITTSYAPSGKYFAIGVRSKEVYIMDAKTGELCKQVQKGHTDIINSIAFSPDGTKIVTTSWDKTIRIWDVESRELVGQPLAWHKE